MANIYPTWNATSNGSDQTDYIQSSHSDNTSLTVYAYASESTTDSSPTFFIKATWDDATNNNHRILICTEGNEQTDSLNGLYNIYWNYQDTVIIQEYATDGGTLEYSASGMGTVNSAGTWDLKIVIDGTKGAKFYGKASTSTTEIQDSGWSLLRDSTSSGHNDGRSRGTQELTLKATSYTGTTQRVYQITNPGSSSESPSLSPSSSESPSESPSLSPSSSESPSESPSSSPSESSSLSPSSSESPSLSPSSSESPSLSPSSSVSPSLSPSSSVSPSLSPSSSESPSESLSESPSLSPSLSPSSSASPSLSPSQSSSESPSLSPSSSPSPGPAGDTLYTKSISLGTQFTYFTVDIGESTGTLAVSIAQDGGDVSPSWQSVTLGQRTAFDHTGTDVRLKIVSTGTATILNTYNSDGSYDDPAIKVKLE